MSHFTHIKTCFRNLVYLERALTKLNISYKVAQTQNLGKKTIIIPQSNGHSIKFVWNEHEYEFTVDRHFWQQSSTVESFNAKVLQQYASEVILSESQKIGFQPIKYQQNFDGSSTLVLERWKHSVN